jgi:hypothetical protein
MYGRVAATHEGNPYDDPPSAYPMDVAFGVMGSSWHDTPSLYGPLFTLGSELHASVVAEDAERAAWLYRAVAALAALGAAIVAAAIGGWSPFAAALVGWNPLLALHFGGGGHNDAVMMLLVLTALLLSARGRPNAAGAAWVAAIAIKWVAAVILVLWGIERVRRKHPLGLAGMAGGTVAIALVSTLAYGTAWLGALQGLSGQARRTGSIGLSKWLGDLGLGHRATLATITLALGAVLAALALHAWRRRARLGVAGSALALGQGWLNPWYASWGVSLSASEEDRLAWTLAIGLTAFLLLDVVPR